MDSRANNDLFFIHEEKFDFDVSMSPASSTGDEDEVFLGPTSHKERCVSIRVASQLQDGSCSGARVSWGVLTEDQQEAVCQEALRVAEELKSGRPHGEGADAAGVTSDTTEREEFVQDPDAKLGMLGKTVGTLSPIKRQTFCVQDSPMKQLPPTIQRQLLRGSSSSTASSTRSTATTAPSTRLATAAASSTRSTATTASSTRPAAKTRLSTSSPVARIKAQPRTALRGKATLGVAVVLPNKPTAPTTSISANKSKVDKTRLQPPSKSVVGCRRSPSSRSSSRAESYEDLGSDSASVASDISDSSFNSSLVGKRMLAPPNKSTGMRNPLGVKAPTLQSRRVTDRRNTSSSSSSVSSFNSSMSVSPAKGKLNSSLNRSLSGSSIPAPSSASRPASHGKLRRSTVYTAAEPAPSASSRRSLSSQARKLSEAEHAKAARATPLKRADAAPVLQTPTKTVLERSISVPSAASGRLQSGLKGKPKVEVSVLPTPSKGSKAVRHAEDVSKILKPKRLMSAGSTDSLPSKLSAGPLTPSAGSCKSLQLKARRPSALPTPVKHRLSAIPAPTPTSQTLRTVKTSSISDHSYTPTSAKKQLSCSPASKDAQEEEEEPSEAPQIEPFCLEVEDEEKPVTAPVLNTQQPTESENMDPEALGQSEVTPKEDLMELETTEETSVKMQEVLLLDLPPPILQPQEKLLIDLTNTPDLIRTCTNTCTATQQLIDLSSPLIKWSPEDKRENAPLINLSF
ncbi:G2 and S phase-expressed protein 1 [Parambassis ranga]|uniref:G2 and S phase-expressed protein 1 n=1 Tax=Parambassis ranga TaxID=210632 RepID=A0A6P7KIK6_9TELE|nr:G2 and S phase-expressed protein 1-like [Parambassis ranga]